jgi:hypothetical protein
MAEQKIIISIQVNSSEAAKTNKTLKVTKDNFEKLTKAEKEAIVADKQLSLAAKQLDKDLTNQAAAANEAAAATDNMRATSGLNNAIIMETSRLASDASFGFTAIANNLSQLVNLVQSNVKATGSFKSAIAGLFTAQAAFLVGIQLLITYGDDLYKMFLKNSSAAIDLFKVFKDAGAEVSSTSGKFETYIRTLQDSNKSQEEQRKAVNGLNKEFPNYIAQLERADLTLEDVANKTEEATKQNDLYRESLKKLALARAAQNKIEEESAAIIQANIDFEDELRKLEAAGAEDADGVPGFSMKDAELSIKAYQDAFDQISKMNLTTQEKDDELIKRKRENRQIASGEYLSSLYDELQEETKIRDENIQRLVKYTIIETDTEESGQGKRERIFKRGILNLDKLEESYRQKAIDKQMKTADEIINIEEKNAKAELKIRLDVFKEKQAQRFKDFMKSKATDEEKKQAQIDYDKSLEDAQMEHDEVMIQLEESFETKRTQLQRKRFNDDEIEREKVEDLEKKQLDSRAANLDAINEMGVKQAFNTRERNLESLKEDEALAQRNFEMASKDVELNEKGMEIKAQAELDLLDLKRKIALEEQALEQEKFDFINEQYSKISDALTETFGVTAHNQTVEIEERYSREMEAAEGNAELQTQIRDKMEKDKDKIARKQFKIDKAARIGRAIMNTYESAWLAFGSQLIPSAPGTLSNAYVAQRIALISGLANVANIARQKYQGSASSGGGGGAGGSGGGMQIKAPDFNVVGASQTSQLAQAVTTQQEKPVKAFVVGKDISTQQELDRNITNTASFG